MDELITNFFRENEIHNPRILTTDLFPKEFSLPRSRFAHKGCFGHGLLIGGAYLKAGACVLASKSCLRAGCGLLTVHIPSKLYDILQISVPEAMVSIDANSEVFSNQNLDITPFDALGIGPGLGKDDATIKAVSTLLQRSKKPIVVDADALNILSTFENKRDYLHENMILTPHPKEFERLFGQMSYTERIKTMQKLTEETGCVIILKGGVTAISTPDYGLVYNTIGNPGMATAGSGDVLTGIILGLLCQGYSAQSAAMLGVYLHAKSGDIAKQTLGEQSIIASDLIKYLPQSICQCKLKK